MKIKNTEEPLKIKTKKSIKKIAVISGITITTLFYVFANKKENIDLNNDNQQNVTYETTANDGFNKYSAIYIDLLNNMDYSIFDQNFIDIYTKGIFIYQDKEYSIDDLYLKTTESGKRYITEAGSKIDLLTGEQITEKKQGSIKLKDSSCFYQMYEDKVFNSLKITINQNIFQNYIDNWDEQKHDATPTLKAENEANIIYNQKYGRK